MNCDIVKILGEETDVALNNRSSLRNTASTSATGIVSTPKSSLGYEEFKRRKRSSRSDQMRSEKKKKPQEVATVQVGVVEDDDGRLKRLKGRTLPLLVQTSSNAEYLTSAAMEKHSKYFKQFKKDADHSIVKTLPGSCKDFILNEYKKDLGKVYSKIYFYLCSKTDFEMVADYADTDDDELAPQLEMTDTIEVSDDDKCEKKTVEAACPSCFRKFPIDVIETHANVCIDNRFDPIGDVSDSELFEDDFPEQCLDGNEKTRWLSPDDQMKKMKDLITECAQNVGEVKIRINVRRKEVFNDYITGSQKPWFNNRRLLKVTFVGEPAVDDGGPRREFFSGLPYPLFTSSC